VDTALGSFFSSVTRGVKAEKQKAQKEQEAALDTAFRRLEGFEKNAAGFDRGGPVAEATRQAGEARGAFGTSSADLLGLQSRVSGPEVEVAEAAKKTARNTDRISQLLEEGALDVAFGAPVA